MTSRGSATGPAARPALDDAPQGAAPAKESVPRADREAFARLRLRPRPVTGFDRYLFAETETRILGRTWAAPVVVVSPDDQDRARLDGEVAMVEGEVVMASVAGSAGLPLVVSDVAGRRLRDIVAAASGPLWLRISHDRGHAPNRELIREAQRAGVQALVLGADTPGRTGSLVERVRAVSPLPLLLEGVLTASDARRAVEAGVDGIVVSHRGDRRPGPAPATVDALPPVASAVGGACPVLLDGGVRGGGDVLAALALGADAVLLGPPVLHGLAVAGRDGAAQVLDLVINELADMMTLTGTTSVADAGPELVRRIT
ncbi:alpha-hydroxy-acid oxidizing protein [Streptomyces sp. NPDC005969]|uniref:alpha-hydroxy-acid oxidizing protein n=1 Tax=Streptomyces sp. NPDC005969 TaxID=3156722 RepID=UPI003404CFE0